jgi:putative phosphotransacetylase
MDHQGSLGCTLIGSQGKVELTQGVIISHRHVHLNPAQAAELGVQDGDLIQARAGQDRQVIFNRVLVRSGSTHEGELHLDTDEGNAAGVNSGDLAELLK